MTIDIAAFCKQFDVPPEHVIATEAGIRIRELPEAEADRVIEALLASGLITSHEEDCDSTEWEP